MSNKAPKNMTALTGSLIERISASILPGDAALTGDRLTEITDFLLETGASRKAGDAAVQIRTGINDHRFTCIAIINKDMPFLVDSVAACVASHGLTIDVLIHPILPVRRDDTGLLTALPEGEGVGEMRESFIYIETPRIDAKQRRSLEKDLASAIADTRAAVDDWPKMRAAIGADADRVADPEGAALLRWLGDGMMIQLGAMTRQREGKQSGLLGICRKGAKDLASDETFNAAFAWFDKPKGQNGRTPLIIKANRLSRVHRPIPLNLFITPIIHDGRVSALSVHVGIWTSAALAAKPTKVPVLRQQMSAVMERLKFEENGHDERALIHALTTLDHDLIISFCDEDVARVATAMMSLAERPRPRIALVTAPLGRHVFGFVWIPRDMLSTATRLKIQALLEEQTGGRTLDWSLSVEGGNLAMLRFVLDSRGQTNTPDSATLDKALQDMLRGWDEAVEAALQKTEDPERAAALATRFSACFPEHFRSLYSADEAALDIARLRHFEGDENQRTTLGQSVRLYEKPKDGAAQLGLKIYQLSGNLALSDAVPALENFGFTVLSETPTTLENTGLTDGQTNPTIHDFTLGLTAGKDSASILARADGIERAIADVLDGRSQDDVFNALVVGSALTAQEAGWMRAFYRYLRQTNIAFTIHTVVDALAAAPAVTRGLIDLFRARHDPDFKGNRDTAYAKAEQAITEGLAEVSAINDDRLLRLYWKVIRAILRTNGFAPSAQEAFAFKMDSALVPGLPKPLPWREIFVYSQRVEGIHLRAGPVARGGIRWSDRRDDFRTEVLGLMKAQRVKNAVIVPTGAKGGFYPKRLPDRSLDRDAWFTEGKESYKLFIRSLLSVTDNLVDDKVVHPEQVVIHDGADPYFVVAADKGTSSFSDTANALAIERGFWLGDAFASGGSNGYDHKAMGITARGGWISVQRHFSEMGIDVQTQSVRVIGCGDMSGDVFGNGLLLSKAVQLVAAFDHRHIFIDPDPDPATSWAERKRLFDMPRSNWAEYNEKLLSKGGGIYSRKTKSIDLSQGARAALGITDASIAPDDLIAAILKSPVDLIWFGGIGTYVKSSDQTHAEVRDPANDALRVNGEAIRAKVIGEGANLGMTQAGRIEFSLAGGRLNTDFIDNSAGVDCSDNEVNIKIALTSALLSGKLTEKRRNALLAEMTDTVAELVLEDNRQQALALSIAEHGGARSVGSYARVIEILEDLGALDRVTAGLGDKEALMRRAADGLGLTRPELAVLLSSSKLVLQDAVEGSDLAKDASADALVLSDFPEALQKDFTPNLLNHRLRNEIVGTVVANQMINRMGIIHPFELADEEGLGLDQIACAFVSASKLMNMNAIWQAIDETPMPESARLALFEQAATGLRRHMADLLRAGNCAASPSKLHTEIGSIITELGGHVEALLPNEARKHSSAIAERLTNVGAPESIAEMVAQLFSMDGAIGIARLSQSTQIQPVDLVKAFTALGSRLRLDWAQAKAADLSPSDPWERLLVAGLARDFQQMRLDFLSHLARKKSAKADILSAMERWGKAKTEGSERFLILVQRAEASGPITPAILAQIASQARNLLQG